MPTVRIKLPAEKDIRDLPESMRALITIYRVKHRREAYR